MGKWIVFVVLGVVLVVCTIIAVVKANKDVRKYKSATRHLKNKCTYCRGKLYLDEQDQRVIDLILLKPYTAGSFSQTPVEIVYTGATVGGVSTGGFHTQGGDLVRTEYSTDRFEFRYWVQEDDEGRSWEAKRVSEICLSKELKEQAKNNVLVKDYLDNYGNILIEVDPTVSAATGLLYKHGKTGYAVNSYNHDLISKFPDINKCERIINFMRGLDG